MGTEWVDGEHSLWPDREGVVGEDVATSNLQPAHLDDLLDKVEPELTKALPWHARLVRFGNILRDACAENSWQAG